MIYPFLGTTKGKRLGLEPDFLGLNLGLLLPVSALRVSVSASPKEATDGMQLIGLLSGSTN